MSPHRRPTRTHTESESTSLCSFSLMLHAYRRSNTYQFTVFSLTWVGLNPTIYCTRGEHVTDAVQTRTAKMQSKKSSVRDLSNLYILGHLHLICSLETENDTVLTTGNKIKQNMHGQVVVLKVTSYGLLIPDGVIRWQGYWWCHLVTRLLMVSSGDKVTDGVIRWQGYWWYHQLTRLLLLDFWSLMVSSGDKVTAGGLVAYDGIIRW